MRKTLALLTLAAPLALAACADDTADNADTDTVAEADISADVATSEPAPLEPVSFADSDETGTYTMMDEEGTSASLSLNSSDKTYEYTDEEGTVHRGNYSYADDYRLMIEDYRGSPAWFSFDNSKLYQLASETSLPQDRITVTAEYSRNDSMTSGGPNAVTASIADKRKTD